MMTIDKFTCAVGSSKADSLVGKAITFFEQRKSDADKCHTFLYENKYDIIETQMFEGARKRPASVYSGKDVSVFRPLFLPRLTMDNMAILANYIVGDSYGFSKIPLLALDNIFKTFWFSQKLGMTNFKVCTHLVGWLYQKTPKVLVSREQLYAIYKGEKNDPHELNYKFGVPWKSLNPDIMEDWMRYHPEEWERIL